MLRSTTDLISFFFFCFMPLPIVRSAAIYFLFCASGFPVGVKFLWTQFVQPHALGFLNLRHLRIVNDDLHHSVTQRSDLLPDNLQTVTLFIVIAACFGLCPTHFKLV